METHDKTLAADSQARRMARRVRLPEQLNGFWKSKYADWELPDINITHLVTKFVGAFDAEAWNQSLKLLLARHPILNSRVELNGDEAELVLDSIPGDLLSVFEMPPSQDDGGQTALRRLTASLVWKPIAPKGGRLFRAFLIRVSQCELVLGVVVHHSIVDGWSMAIIGRELLAGYAASVTGRECSLPRPGPQYLDYIEWMRNWLVGPDAQSEKEYWACRMADAKPLCLPAEDGVDPDALAEWAHESFSIGLPMVLALRKRAGLARSTPFLLALSANIAPLSVITGLFDIVVVVVMEQRPGHLRNTVGLLVNFLPIRVAMNWKLSFEELAARVRATYMEACAHQTYPYALINPREDVFPTFRFRRIVGGDEGRKPRSLGFQFFELPAPPPTRTPARGAGQELFLLQTDESMSCRVRYLPCLNSKETVRRFTRLFCRALALTSYDCAQPLSALLDEGVIGTPAECLQES